MFSDLAARSAQKLIQSVRRYCPTSTEIALCPTWCCWKFVHRIAALPTTAVSCMEHSPV